VVVVERGVVKKIAIMIFIFSFLLIHFSTPAQAALQIWPGKLIITMSEGYPKEPITYYIEVTNPDNYSVNAYARVGNPAIQLLSKGYTYIPDLSWITVKPEKLYLSPNSTGKFQISIDIPENEKPSQYNKSWYTELIISHNVSSAGISGGAEIQIEIAIKILIHTPPGNNFIVAQPFYFIIAFVVPIAITCVVIFYIKKRYSTRNNKP
jgi:hypothetical protein